MIEKAVWIEARQTDPYFNLAIEQRLMEMMEADTVLMYLWQNQHTIVIGRNQNPWSECRVEAFLADGGKIARRFSGGGAVYHDLGNLNFTLLIPEEIFDISRQLEVVIRAMAILGIHAERSGRNDLTADGRKFSGNAFQIRNKMGCHHGTLLVKTDLAAAEKWLTVEKSKLEKHNVQSVASRMMNLCEARPELSIMQVKQALLQAFAASFAIEPKMMRQEDVDLFHIQKMAQTLSSKEWLFPQHLSATELEETQTFSWGNLDVHLWLKNGIIEDVVIYTDALEAQLIQDLTESLRNVRWDIAGLEGIRQKMYMIEGKNQHHIVDDIIMRLEQRLKHL